MSFDFLTTRSFCGCNKEPKQNKNVRRRSNDSQTQNTEPALRYDYKQKYDALRKENKNLRIKLMKEKERVDEVQNILESKAFQIENMKDEIERLRQINEEHLYKQQTTNDDDEKQLESETLALQLSLDGSGKLQHNETKSILTSPKNELLVTLNPSIIANPNFNADEAVRSIKLWLQKCSNIKQFKERMAKLLTSFNAAQRGQIASKYPEVMQHITQKLKKGSVLSLCNVFCMFLCFALRLETLLLQTNKQTLSLFIDCERQRIRH